MIDASGNDAVLVVGATGRLGGLITRALLDQGAAVRLLVRPDSQAKARGQYGDAVTIIEGDLGSAPERLRAACEGVRTVVSVVQGGPDVIVDGQLALLQAAAAAGVQRFIPSDYSYDLFSVRPGANVNSDWRRTFAERAQAVRGSVQLTHVLNGCFLDMGVLFGFLGAFDLAKGTFSVWGDGHEPMDFTTYEDTARFTALAALRDQVPDRVQVAGDVLDAHSLVQVVQEASGRSLEVIERGSLADLDAEIDRRVASDPSNIYAYLPLMYWRAMLDGSGKLRSLVTDQFPEVTPTTVRAYVERHAPAFGAEGPR